MKILFFKKIEYYFIILTLFFYLAPVLSSKESEDQNKIKTIKIFFSPYCVSGLSTVKIFIQNENHLKNKNIDVELHYIVFSDSEKIKNLADMSGLSGEDDLLEIVKELSIKKYISYEYYHYLLNFTPYHYQENELDNRISQFYAEKKINKQLILDILKAEVKECRKYNIRASPSLVVQTMDKEFLVNDIMDLTRYPNLGDDFIKSVHDMKIEPCH